MTKLIHSEDPRPVVDLIQIGLKPYQARVLFVLVGTDEPLNSNDIAQRSGVPRTSVYHTAPELVQMGLAFVVPGTGSMRWGADSWDDTLFNLGEWAARRHGETMGRIDKLRGDVL